MGFLLRKYPDYTADLLVSFNEATANDTFTPTNNIDEAIEYFKITLKDGVMYVPTPQDEKIEELDDEVKEQTQKINTILTAFVDDTAAQDYIEFFPAWRADMDVTVGERYVFNDVIYKVLIAHHTQTEWMPPLVPSLFARILVPTPDVIPDWEQPDSTNGYMTGDKVRYNDKIYESLIDNNVWAPDAYPAGWQEVIEEEGE